MNSKVEKIMKEIENNSNIKIWKGFAFPEQIPLTIRLKDILEKSVDEKYYLPDERIEKILNSTFVQEKKRIQTTDVCDTLLARDWKDPKCVAVEEEPKVHQLMNIMPTKTRDNPNQGRVYDVNGLAPTLTKMDGGNREPMVIEKESSTKKIVIIEDQFPGSRDARIYENYSPTLRQNCGGLEMADGEVAEKIKWRIRKLTPKCCWRLMNFTDKDCDRAAKYVSPSSQYKQAGNSIVVAVLIALMSSLFIEDGHKAEVWTTYTLNFND